MVENDINNVEALGSISITDNGNEVRRSARIRVMNIVSAIYVRRQRTKYLKHYKGMRNALLIKKVSGNIVPTPKCRRELMCVKESEKSLKALRDVMLY